VDHAPRHLDQEACRDLDDFGRLVENTLHDLERRHQVRSLNQVLEDKDHLFTLTFNQSSVGMALSSLEGKWLRANPGLERLLGYSEQAMLSRTWHAMTHPEDLPRELPLFNALLAGQRQDYRLEKRMIRADGSQCWVQLSVTLCHSRTMAPHLIAVFADLTERKQAEAELLQLQQGLERQVRERTRRDAGAYPARPARQRSPPAGPADPSPECCAPSGVRDRHPRRPAHPGGGDCRALPVRRQGAHRPVFA
jgi:PAS domain S-box-containing protein